MNPGPLSTFSAVRVVHGSIRRLWFEAAGEPEAREFCVAIGAGYEGPSKRDESALPAVALDEKTARALCGGISPSTLYRELAVGNLERVPGIRKILVTRESIERWASRRR